MSIAKYLAALLLLVPLHAVAANDSPVTLKGSLICNGGCIPKPGPDDHLLVLYVIDGTPAVRAQVAKIIKEFYPEKGLDADAAEKLMDQFTANLKFYIAPDSPALKGNKNKGANHYCMPAADSAITGAITEKDDKHWINATKIEQTQLKFPDRMLEADKPFVMPEKDPLVLKINDKLTLTCICIPPGKFLMGTPFYMWPYFVEEYPHLVTFTRPFYLAEIPITQEIYHAVMGTDVGKIKSANMPIQDPSFADIQKFCEKLSTLTGRKVRLPTDAEWEYAARVGTSNPGFQEKYADQNSSGPDGFKSTLAVKSKKPNAWGLYDMASSWWEITGDQGIYNARQPETDPHYPPGQEDAKSQRSGRGLIKEGWSIGTHEFITQKGYAGQKFRIAVEDESPTTRPAIAPIP